MTNSQKAKRIFLIICLVSIGLVGLRYFLMMAGSRGGGQGLDSPNELYEALATSYSMKRFWGGTRKYYEFGIKDNESGDWIRYVQKEHLGDKPQFWMRDGERIISWSSDSSEVTFAFQEVKLKLKVEEDKDK
jgi:hypothetical protein